MESEDPYRYYLDEVNDTQHDIHNLDLEEHIPNGKSSFIWLFINTLISHYKVLEIFQLRLNKNIID